MSNDNYLNVLAEESNISLNKVLYYYDFIRYIPCIKADDGMHSLNCLYLLIELLKNKDKDQSFNYILSDALYKTYGDDSIPYLSDDNYKTTISLKKKIN